jgi:cytochrome c553
MAAYWLGLMPRSAKSRLVATAEGRPQDKSLARHCAACHGAVSDGQA